MPSPEISSTSRAMTRRAALATLGGGAAALLTTPAWAVDGRRPGSVASPSLTGRDRVVVGQVSAQRAVEHVLALSEGIGPRIGGTSSEAAAADYIAGVLESHGYDVRLEPFGVADKFLADLASSPGLPDDMCWQAGASPQGVLYVTVTAPVVDLGSGVPVGTDLDGAVALVDETSTAARTAQVQAVVAAGAGAVVLFRADSVAPRQTSASSPALAAPVPVPVVGVAQSQKQVLRERAAAGSSTLTISTVSHRGLTSHNVLGSLSAKQGPPSSDRRAVMVSAHYDSVIGAPGANDDGSGTALCLELARVLRNVPTRTDLQFSLWGSEEQGLSGSRYHVSQLDQAERDRLVAVFQNDMVATSWDPATRYWLLSFDGQDNPATASVAAAAQRLGYSPQLSPVTQRGASDHQSFQEVGIASANFSWRGEQSPALLEPPYHSPLDTVARNISLERLQVSLELIGAATYQLAREG